MKNSAIFIILLLFLAATSFFWFQSLRVKDIPPPKHSSTPSLTGKDAEEFIKLAEELLVDYREPLPSAYRRDPFYREKPVEQPKMVKPEADPFEKLVLSSIIHSELNALAVVNGKILAEGDTIYDKESESAFMIESIGVDRVEIINNDKKYTLRKAAGVGGRRRSR